MHKRPFKIQFIFFLNILFSTFSSFSQTQKDSLEVSTLIDSAKYLTNIDAKAAMNIANKLLAKTKKFNDKKYLGLVYSLIGIIKDNEADINGAKRYYDSSYVQYKIAGYPLGISMYYNNMGLLSNKEGNYNNALMFYLKGLKISDSIKNERMNSRFYNNIGFLYNNMEQYNLAIPYFKKALEIHTKNNNKIQIGRVTQNLAISYEMLNDLANAEKMYLTALENEEALKDSVTLGYSFDNIGGLYKKQGKFEKAFNYHVKAYNIIKGLNDVAELATIENNLSEICFEIKKYDLALKYAIEALSISDASKLKRQQVRAYHNIATYYSLTNNYKTANEYLQKENELTITMFNEDIAKSASEMMVKYQTEKKENENKLLIQQNAIKSLEIENNTQKLKIRNITIFILIAIMAVIAILILWQINLSKLKKQKRELEAQQKIQIERERISRDLHDNVGGQLSYVLFSLEGDEEISTEKRRERATTLASSIRSITRNLRETIWALNQEKLTLKNLSDKLKLYARNMFAYTDTKIKFEEHIDDDNELNPAFALNLFRICQEVINNVFKHAKASELTVTIERKEKIKICITDNGIGFDKNDLPEDNHFGLSNLHSRAKEINATIDIESSINNGSKITLVV
ncbi:MAG: hypothetical protein A3F72_07765 [Bacteroidetes bacterium RIFCSPLOWO2_12_FULL_35_15]|nr:MAG: hypothetical protein A3F72_07765 [Bacteroidetes bacterium RIFCSPLOWO2_12_FULL_35_15]